MFGLGMPELLVIALICLLLFGAKNLPELGKSLGKTLSEFKKGVKEGEAEAKDAAKGPDSSDKK